MSLANVEVPVPLTVRIPPITVSPFSRTSNKGAAAESNTEKALTELEPVALVILLVIVVTPLILVVSVAALSPNSVLP